MHARHRFKGCTISSNRVLIYGIHPANSFIDQGMTTVKTDDIIWKLKSALFITPPSTKMRVNICHYKGDRN